MAYQIKIKNRFFGESRYLARSHQVETHLPATDSFGFLKSPPVPVTPYLMILLVSGERKMIPNIATREWHIGLDYGGEEPEAPEEALEVKDNGRRAEEL